MSGSGAVWVLVINVLSNPTPIGTYSTQASCVRALEQAYVFIPGDARPTPERPSQPAGPWDDYRPQNSQPAPVPKRERVQVDPDILGVAGCISVEKPFTR